MTLDEWALEATASGVASGQEFREAVGARLRVLRLARGMSQRQVAEGAGLHRTVIGRVERGEINFGVDYLWRLAVVLRADVHSLVPDADHSSREAVPPPVHPSTARASSPRPRSRN